MIGGANACGPAVFICVSFATSRAGSIRRLGMDELSCVLGEVLRVLGMEGPERPRPARGSAERLGDRGDGHDVDEERSNG